MNMLGKKTYLQPIGTVLNTIHDIIELLKSGSTVSDTPNGKVSTRLTMYGYKWDVLFTVTDIGKNRCDVVIEIEGERQDKRREIRSIFSLLDSMLLTGAEIEYEEKLGVPPSVANRISLNGQLSAGGVIQK